MEKYKPWVLTLISGFAVYIFDKLFGDKIPWDQIADLPIIEWLTLKISVYQISLFALVFYLLYIVVSRVKKPRSNNDSIYSKKQQLLLKFNSTVIGDILWRWDVYFDLSDKPKISELQPYCNNHGDTPMKMSINSMTSSFRCPIPDCRNEVMTNEIYSMYFDKYKQVIESLVEKRWEEIKNASH